ncbi:Nuclear transport factor 2 (NTF2) family protein with RNA binding (RRM-RBD-RNP motifs) domain [Striga hermonthica]|uniref:Nuclear transport factor 2 (NTF2) family protein with RNA binding (RRM-RBD-RNP motifs) domain n=1 Tax=Striga hermonthica TaxID=68872 RepID=A0A9N7NDX6_STRHE|nr:Nuclear transport factor 2 (NTF2) family protein with RNA binding (RRM-RBD-RNP motifs) domain [Striga hermonthica]
MDNITPQQVADAFVVNYYKILSDSPQQSYKFYNESSLLSWPDFDGILAPVKTLNAINEKIMSSDFKNFTIEINTVDAQASQDGGVIVAVTGSLIEDDQVTNIFFQTFFLAKQENGFFVLNDNLRIFDSFGSMTNAAANPLAVQTSEGCNVSDSSKSPQIEKAEIKEALDNSVVPKDSVAKSSSSLSPAASEEKAVPAVKVPSIVVPASNASTPPKVPSIVVPVSNANMPPKPSYASMLAKDAPVTSPKSATPKSAVVTPSPKAPLKNGMPKSSSKIVSKSPPSGKSEPEAKTPPEAKGVFVGSLPYEITEKALRDALNQFGPIRKYPDAVQIRKHNDGFCLAFVEFESADSARRAVEVHHVKFGEKEAYIAHKKSTGRVRSPTRTGFRNGNGNKSDYDKGRARDSQVGRSSGHGARSSRDHTSN